MAHRVTLALVALGVLMVVPGPAASSPERLDLDVDPAEVEDTQPPPHDLVIAPGEGPSVYRQAAKEPGWSLRPTADVDVGRDGGEQAAAGADERTLDLGNMSVDLNSLGLRLQRTW